MWIDSKSDPLLEIIKKWTQCFSANILHHFTVLLNSYHGGAQRILLISARFQGSPTAVVFGLARFGQRPFGRRLWCHSFSNTSACYLTGMYVGLNGYFFHFVRPLNNNCEVYSPLVSVCNVHVFLTKRSRGEATSCYVISGLARLNRQPIRQAALVCDEE